MCKVPAILLGAASVQEIEGSQLIEPGRLVEPRIVGGRSVQPQILTHIKQRIVRRRSGQIGLVVIIHYRIYPVGNTVPPKG